jgi:hypothetical protein
MYSYDKLAEALVAYKQWEADLLNSDGPSFELFGEELVDKLDKCQKLRNNALQQYYTFKNAVSGLGCFNVGDKVIKSGGDYTFEGTVVSIFQKLDGSIRYVIEDSRGILFLMKSSLCKS